MATSHQNSEQQYQGLISKHKQYLKIQEEYRQANWHLKREIEKMEILNEMVYSTDYQQKIDDAIARYHQLEALQQEYSQMMKEEEVKPQAIELAKVQNEKLRQKISQLNFQVAIQSTKSSTYEKECQVLQKFVGNQEERLEKCRRQVEELKDKEPFKESVWRRLGIQRMEKILENAQNKTQMTNQSQVNLVKSGRFMDLIYQKVEEVQKLQQKMKQDLRIMKEKEILNQQLKIQNNIVSKMFGFDSFEGGNDNEQDLRAEDAQLDSQIERLQQQIKRGQEEEQHLRQNLSEIAKNSAIKTTKDYLTQKGREITYKLKVMQQTLPLVLMGGSEQANQQAQHIIKQITAMRQELLRLEERVSSHQGMSEQ